MPDGAQTGSAESPTYDAIGVGYADKRHPDPRIASRIVEALDGAQNVLNVGAGAGSYEPLDRAVVAVDPSMEMMGQRSPDVGPPVRAVAERLPFRDQAFDAVMAMLTVHHWVDRRAGYAELRRVAPLRVIFTYEPDVHNRQWIVEDYFPEIAELDHRRPGFSAAEVADGIGATNVVTVPVPWDCTDGFIMAYWRRPEAFLDPQVRRATSGFSLIDQKAVERGLRRLEADLASGAWAERYGHLNDLDELDTGLRLVVGRG